jgi:hypothetical protein
LGYGASVRHTSVGISSVDVIDAVTRAWNQAISAAHFTQRFPVTNPEPVAEALTLSFSLPYASFIGPVLQARLLFVKQFAVFQAGMVRLRVLAESQVRVPASST